MDRTVLAATSLLLCFLAQTEVGSTGRASYDVIYGHNQGNRIRDEYVRLVDLDHYLKQLRESVRELRDETREASHGRSTRRDRVLAVLAKIRSDVPQRIGNI
jgi:hypothetical protein